MFGMKDIKPASVAISALLGGILLFSAGCGGSSGGGGGGGGTPTEETNPYEGSATLTGTVSLSGLSAQDTSCMYWTRTAIWKIRGSLVR
jgi:hypothetical protein